jgi:hypothetical protein
MNVEMAVPMTAKTTIEPRFWKKLPYSGRERKRERERENDLKVRSNEYLY